MEQTFSTTEINILIKKCSASKLLTSSRRIFFNYLEQSTEERGHFHVDQMHGGGTGILIKYMEIFFLLTAKHVIEENTKFDYQSESPFWVTSLSREWPVNLYGFLMPKRIWHIGKGISWTSSYTDPEDILLIELFYPNPNYWPDGFLDLDQNDLILEEENFYDGQLLLTQGYPLSDNDFFYENVPEGYTHGTNLLAQTLPATLNFENDERFMKFITQNIVEHENLNGFNGSPICNLQPDLDDIKWAGMLTSGGNNMARFIPSYALRDSLFNFQDFPFEIVDPSAMLEKSSVVELSDFYRGLRELFGK
jgi:hypothetical protein